MKFRTAVLSQLGQLLKIESLNCADWRTPTCWYGSKPQAFATPMLK